MAEIGKSDDDRIAEPFELAGWTVDPATCRMTSGAQTVKLEPKVMEVLVFLARRQGRVVSRDELAAGAWPGTVVGDDAVTNSVLKLRRAFGDDTRAAKLIETIPKRGYRLLDTTEPHTPQGAAAEAAVPEGAERGAMVPTIAVLPFRNLSGDAAQEYFSDGISEDLTTALSTTGWYQVRARDSAFAYKGKAVDARQIGRELGVQYLLEGSVRRMGDRLRVTAQLIEAGSGKNLWGHRYDGGLADVFDFQDQITETIVGTVESTFHRVEGERVRHKRPESMEAYDYLLRGLAHMNRLTPEETRSALQYFRKAIDKDPNYGRAYAYAFWCYRREERAAAIGLMEAGLRSDRDDPIVLWQAATLKSYFERDFEGAQALLKRSLAIDPNSPRAWNASAEVHCFLGDSDTARQHAQHALRISPQNPTLWVSHTRIAEAHFQDLRYGEAADAAKTALQLNRYNAPALLVLAASCAHLGWLAEAQAAVRSALQLNPKLTVAKLPDLFPISRFKNLEAYLEGLRRAGVPE
jgi:TolB-like protein/Tfp pilus assembly protein PilF